MSLVQASKIAAYIALIRAIESNRPQNERLFYDPYAKAFLFPALKLVEKLSTVPFLNRFAAWYIETFYPGAYSAVVARTRLIDLMTIECIQNHGVNQVIILGAGFDCRAHRLHVREKVQFVEVDHPHTQRSKQEILSQLQEKKPTRHVDYIAMNFSTQMPEDVIPRLLQRHHYTTLFIWEGVTNDLTARMGTTVFRYFNNFPTGTRILFTYVDKKILEQPDTTRSNYGASVITRLLRRNNEFWGNCIDPDTIGSFLAGYNMKLLYEWGATEYRQKYYGERARKMKGYEYYRVAMAIIQ